MLGTTDGGTTWTMVGSIPAVGLDCVGDCDGAPEVSHLRFANAEDGYAFGPDFFVSTDAGAAWSRETGSEVDALEPSGSDVLRVAYTQSGCPGPCDLRIQEAVAGSSAWRSLTAPFQGDAVQLVRQGPNDVYVAVFENPAGGAGSAHATLMLSDNGGETWTERPDPCGEINGDEFDTSAIAAAPGSVLSALCNGRLQAASFVATSTDGGATFVAHPLIPESTSFDALAVTSAFTLFVGTSEVLGSGTEHYLLLFSHDGGQTWETTVSEAGSAESYVGSTRFLGFENPSVGGWVGDPHYVWRTTDGGTTWVREAIADFK
jgi:photosystem II stability/assembly factor-like uncharacterized protein